MVRDWISKPLNLALGMGLCFGLTSNASAQNYVRQRPAQPYCPPGYTMPGAPSPSMRPTPTAPSRPTDPTQPTDPNAQQPTDPNAQQQPTDPSAQQPQAQQPSPTDFSQAPSADASGAGGPMSSGAAAPIAGRLDSVNRFNLFDNMTAFPTTRAWVGYQYTDGTNTQVRLSDQGEFVRANFPSYYQSRAGQDEGILRDHGQHAYRFGAEVMVFDNLSVAAQGQYVDPTISNGAEEHFTNPQFMVKYLFLQTQNCAVAATFGYQPEIGNGRREVQDITDRYYPGLLGYTQLTDELFMQTSGQFGLPQSGDLYTADWAVSFGYWLYRHETLSRQYGNWRGGLCRNGLCSSGGPMLLGIVPQIEFFGHHVLGDTTYKGPAGLSEEPIGDPDGIGAAPFFNDPFYLGDEPRHIYDATAAVQWILHHGLVLGTGVSFPLNNRNARDLEFLATLNCYF